MSESKSSYTNSDYKSGDLSFKFSSLSISDSKNIDDDSVLFSNEPEDSKNIEETPSIISPLDLSSLPITNAYQSDKKYNNDDDELLIQEEEILVNFEFADSSQGESYFKRGQTVQFLKSHIEIEYGIPMKDQILYLVNEELDDNDPKKLKRMDDPFSLLDYPAILKKNEIYILVEGNSSKLSRK